MTSTEHRALAAMREWGKWTRLASMADDARHPNAGILDMKAAQALALAEAVALDLAAEEPGAELAIELADESAAEEE